MEGSQYLGGEGAQNLMGIGLLLVQSLYFFVQYIHICMGSHGKVAANLPTCIGSLSRTIHH